MNSWPGKAARTNRTEPQFQHRTQPPPGPLPVTRQNGPPKWWWWRGKCQWPSTSACAWAPSAGDAWSFVALALSTGPSGFFVPHTSIVSFVSSSAIILFLSVLLVFSIPVFCRPAAPGKIACFVLPKITHNRLRLWEIRFYSLYLQSFFNQTRAI